MRNRRRLARSVLQYILTAECSHALVALAVRLAADPTQLCGTTAQVLGLLTLQIGGRFFAAPARFSSTSTIHSFCRATCNEMYGSACYPLPPAPPSSPAPPASPRYADLAATARLSTDVTATASFSTYAPSDAATRNSTPRAAVATVFSPDVTTTVRCAPARVVCDAPCPVGTMQSQGMIHPNNVELHLTRK